MTKKTTTTSLRLSPETLLNWRTQAEAANLSLSDWLREKVDASEMTGLPPPSSGYGQSNVLAIDPLLVQQLAQIGNNLNQLARALNTSKKIGHPIDVAQALTVLVAIEQQISPVLGALPPSPSLTRSSDAVARAKSRYAKKRAAQLKKRQQKGGVDAD